MAFPRSPRRQASDTLTQILSSDPVLRAGVRTWRLFEGRPEDQTPKNPVTYPLLIWLPLEGSQGASRVLDTCGHREVEAVFDFELRLQGTDQGALLDFAGAVESALFPPDEARAAVVADLIFRSPILDGSIRVRGVSARQEPGLNLCWGQGSIACLIQF